MFSKCPEHQKMRGKTELVENPTFLIDVISSWGWMTSSKRKFLFEKRRWYSLIQAMKNIEKDSFNFCIYLQSMVYKLLQKWVFCDGEIRQLYFDIQIVRCTFYLVKVLMIWILKNSYLVSMKMNVFTNTSTLSRFECRQYGFD